MACGPELVENVEGGRSDGVSVDNDENGAEGTEGCVRRYTSYVLGRCSDLLDRAGADRVILVFDGRRCPLKAGGAGCERERRRGSNLEEARRLRRLGRASEAGDRYRACVRVTGGMARRTAGAVRKRYGVGGLGGGGGGGGGKR